MCFSNVHMACRPLHIYVSVILWYHGWFDVNCALCSCFPVANVVIIVAKIWVKLSYRPFCVES